MHVSRYPLVEEISTSLTAPEAFALIKDNPHSFFLDSGMDPQKLVRLRRGLSTISDVFQSLQQAKAPQ